MAVVISCGFIQATQSCLVKCFTEHKIITTQPLLFNKRLGPQSLYVNCGRMHRKDSNSKAKKGGNGGGGGGGGFGGVREEQLWQCAQRCGACCKLDKGPSFATPEEIFDDPSDVHLYRSMIGPDGWCTHFEKTTRMCSIYEDRPYFCHVEPGVFKQLYGISVKKFDKEACSFCRDTIKAIYGSRSQELDNFNRTVKSSRLVDG